MRNWNRRGIRLRYPEYCREQKPIEEIPAEMERKRAEDPIDGNKGTNRYYRAHAEVQKAGIKEKANGTEEENHV